MTAAATPLPVVVDCDPGHDDAFALMLAAAHPALDLRSITTVGGNQTVAKTTLNARRVCTVAGITGVPLAAGLDRPLNGRLEVAEDIHGESGLDGPEFGEPTVPVEAVSGIDQLRRVITEAEVPVAVIVTGPCTNIAALLAAHPEVKQNIARVSLMGGTASAGNVSPFAEFNIAVDPEAADIVFTSGLPITMSGLDVTHQALATSAVLDRIRALDTDLARVSVELLTFFAQSYHDTFGFTAPPVHDPVAVAALIDPAIVGPVDAVVDIELRGTRTRGATVVDLYHRTDRAPNAQVAMHLDAGRFWDLMVDAIASLGS